MPFFCFFFRAETASTLRDVRDRVLNLDPTGRELVDLYYQLGPYLVQELRAKPELRNHMHLLDRLLNMVTQRLETGATAWSEAERREVLDFFRQLDPGGGPEWQELVARLERVLNDDQGLARLGLVLSRQGETFTPLVSYIDLLPSGPNQMAAVEVVGNVSGADLQVGTVEIPLPPGFVFSGLPASDAVGSLSTEVAGSMAIRTSQGQAYVDTNANGAYEGFFDIPIQVAADRLSVIFNAGGDANPSVSSFPGAPRLTLTLSLNSGLFQNPAASAALGIPVTYFIRSVNASTGQTTNPTFTVENTVPVTITDLTGRVIADPPVVGLGSAPSLTARLNNSGAARSADLYLGILRPDGALFTLNGALQWTQQIGPVLSNLGVPAGFSLEDVALPADGVFTLAGDYELLFATTAPGTFNFISLTTTRARVE